MKTTLLILLLMVSTAWATDEETSIPLVSAMERFGSVSITDGISFYTFSQDGSFQSGPLGLSGRTLEGRWTTDDGRRFTATAKQGWRNGLSSSHEYRRVQFVIFDVRQQPPDIKPVFGILPPRLFRSFFYIAEEAKVPESTITATP